MLNSIDGQLLACAGNWQRCHSFLYFFLLSANSHLVVIIGQLIVNDVCAGWPEFDCFSHLMRTLDTFASAQLSSAQSSAAGGHRTSLCTELQTILYVVQISHRKSQAELERDRERDRERWE